MAEAVRVLWPTTTGSFSRVCRAAEVARGFEVVGEATTGAEAVAQAGHLQLDVILMDIGMTDLSGVEATRRILAESPHIGMLMVTMFDDDELVFTAMRARARGYVLKGAD